MAEKKSNISTNSTNLAPQKKRHYFRFHTQEFEKERKLTRSGRTCSQNKTIEPERNNKLNR